MPSIEIRMLTADDAREYWHLRLEALEIEIEAFRSSAEEHRVTSVADAAVRLAGDPANRFFVGAFVDGQLAGSAGFYREPGLKERHKGHVTGVYLKAAMRGMGIGRRVMETLLARAAWIEGVEQIGLTVTATQPAAMALYQSLGFRSFGREHHALKLADRRYVDKEYMVLTCERLT